VPAVALSVAYFLTVGCATVDMVRIEDNHHRRLSNLESQYKDHARSLRAKRDRHLREIEEKTRPHAVAMDHGELVAPVVDAEQHQRLLLCASLAACERLESEAVAAIDEHYQRAPAKFRQRAADALVELPPSKRIRAYERIMAHGQNTWASARADRARAEVESAYREAVAVWVEHYRGGVAESESLRAAELVEEEERVARQNSETAAAVLKGVAVAAAVVVAARSGGAGGSQPSGRSTKTLEICGYTGADLQGCCSWNGGVDVINSNSITIMCIDGRESPTCECRSW